MLPDTQLICELGAGATLCDAGAWHAIFLTQTVLVLAIAVGNLVMGLRHRLGRGVVPVGLARRFTAATALAGLVPLGTGLWLRQAVKEASYLCYLDHPVTRCAHSLLDRAAEMQQVTVWVGWIEAVLLGASAAGLLLLRR